MKKSNYILFLMLFFSCTMDQLTVEVVEVTDTVKIVDTVIVIIDPYDQDSVIIIE